MIVGCQAVFTCNYFLLKGTKSDYHSLVVHKMTKYIISLVTKSITHFTSS